MSRTSHRFDVALLAEWRKLTSTALWWVLGLGMAAYLAFMGAVLAFTVAAAPPSPDTPAITGVDAALAVLGTLNAIGYVFPLLVGTSRKRLLTDIEGGDKKARDAGTAATSVILRLKGAAIFRVHNVAANRDALAFADAMLEREKASHR